MADQFWEKKESSVRYFSYHSTREMLNSKWKNLNGKCLLILLKIYQQATETMTQESSIYLLETASHIQLLI